MRALWLAILAATVTFADQRVTLHGRDAHGRWFDLDKERGKLVAITFASPETERDARLINDTLARHPIYLVSVVELDSAPVDELKKLRREDRPGHVRHLIDRGEIARKFGIDPRHHVDVFLVDRQGRMLGHFVGAEQLGEAEVRIEKEAAGP